MAGDTLEGCMPSKMVKEDMEVGQAGGCNTATGQAGGCNTATGFFKRMESGASSTHIVVP